MPIAMETSVIPALMYVTTAIEEEGTEKEMSSLRYMAVLVNGCSSSNDSAALVHNAEMLNGVPSSLRSRQCNNRFPGVCPPERAGRNTK